MDSTKLSEIILRSVKISENAHKFGNVYYLTLEAKKELKAQEIMDEHYNNWKQKSR